MIRFAFSIVEASEDEDFYNVYLCDGNEITSISFLYDVYTDEVFDLRGNRADAKEPRDIIKSGVAPLYCSSRLDYVFDCKEGTPEKLREHLKDATFRILESLKDDN
jgi:hypothetical protein